MHSGMKGPKLGCGSPDGHLPNISSTRHCISSHICFPPCSTVPCASLRFASAVPTCYTMMLQLTTHRMDPHGVFLFAWRQAKSYIEKDSGGTWWDYALSTDWCLVGNGGMIHRSIIIPFTHSLSTSKSNINLTSSNHRH